MWQFCDMAPSTGELAGLNSENEVSNISRMFQSA